MGIQEGYCSGEGRPLFIVWNAFFTAFPNQDSCLALQLLWWQCFLLGNSDIRLHRCRIPRPPCHLKRFNVLQSPVGLWGITVSPFPIQVSIVRLEMLWAWWGRWFRMVSIFVTKGRWLLASTILSMVPPCFVRSFSKASLKLTFTLTLSSMLSSPSSHT